MNEMGVNSEKRSFEKIFKRRQFYFNKILPIIFIVFSLLLINLGLKFRLAPEEPFNEFVYPYEENFDDVDIHKWFKNESSGVWTVRENKLTQTQLINRDMNIFVPRWLVSERRYKISVEIELISDGKAAGINFNAQYPNIFFQHHRVLIMNSGAAFELSTGLVTKSNEYEERFNVSLNSIDFPARLDVYVGEDTYEVWINGKKLIENRPLVFRNGLVGLIASGGPVIFDDLILAEDIDVAFKIDLSEFETSLPDVEYIDLENILYSSNFGGNFQENDWQALSGNWEIIDGYLSQQNPEGFNFGIVYRAEEFRQFILRAAFSHKEGIGAGLLFNMPESNHINGAHMVRFAESGNGVFWGYFNQNGTFIGQGYAIMSVNPSSAHTIKVVSGEGVYDIYVDNQKIANNIELMSNSGFIGLTTTQSSAAFALVDISNFRDNSIVELAREISIWSDPLRAQQSILINGFSSNSENMNWIPISGHWRTSQNTLLQTDQGGYDFAIVYQGEIFQDYQLDVPLNHIRGRGAGIIFNMLSQDNLKSAIMVRYSDVANLLMWGYFGGDGLYMGQGYAEVASPELDTHTISVVSKEDSYDLYLDGQTVVKDVPSIRNNGYIGLITSRSTARFGPISLSSLSNAASTPTLGEMKIVSGSWSQIGNLIVQNDSEFTDHILSTGIFGRIYSIEIDISVPDFSERFNGGGGIIFHMPGERNWANANMVRLADDGMGLFWGSYNENGVFSGQGFISFDQVEEIESRASRYIIKIQVRSDSYDIFVNQINVASNVNLVNREGFIALLSFRGPISFEDPLITLGYLE